jgi:hypothetical protein
MSRLLKQVLFAIAGFFIAYQYGYHIQKKQLEPVTSPVTVIYYAPELVNAASESSRTQWLGMLQDHIRQYANINPSKICYAPSEQHHFYQEILNDSSVVWRDSTDVFEKFHHHIGFNLNKNIINNNDAAHLINLLNLDPEAHTVSMASDYLAAFGDYDLSAPISSFLQKQDNVRLIAFFDSPHFYIYDKFLLLSQAADRWKRMTADFAARCQQYRSLLSETFSPEQLLFWAQKHPFDFFYLPAVKDYCFGRTFWTQSFWHRNAHYIGLSAQTFPHINQSPLIVSPRYCELQLLFADSAADIAYWIALVGLCATSSTASKALYSQEACASFNRFSESIQKQLQHFYPDIYHDYLLMTQV